MINPRDSSGTLLPLSPLALFAALLPLATVHACYLISAMAEHIPLCVPYVHGCTSISAAGRHGAGYFLFKAGMLPAAVLFGLFWLLCRPWLLALGDRPGRAVSSMVWAGLTSSLFLILYAVFLGSKGEFYSFMRRFGVTVFFGAGYLAQLLLLSRLAALHRAGNGLVPIGIVRAKTVVALLTLATGLVGIPVQHLLPAALQPDRDRMQNAIEWNFCLLLIGYYLLSWLAWRSSGFAARTGLAGSLTLREPLRPGETRSSAAEARR